MAQHRVFWCIALVLSVTVDRGTALTPAGQPTATPVATAAFADGSEQIVENPVFVYRWVDRNRREGRSESTDFHYIDVVRGVTLDRLVQRSQLQRMDVNRSVEGFAWGPLNPTSVVLTLVDGKKLTLEPRNLGAATVFLTGLPVEEIKEDVRVDELSVEGVATVDGQRGRFKAAIIGYGEPGRAMRSLVFARSTLR